MPESPASLGYSMPAEWSKHESTWLSWPKNPLTFPPEVLPEVEAAYVAMIEALAKGERVDLLVDDQETEDRVLSMTSPKNLVCHHIKSADVWMRDYGPIFVKRSGKRGEVAATKWRFNAWGAKYDDLLPDDSSGLEVAKASGKKIFTPGIILEGGSIDGNGKGLLLTTEQCLLNKNRNAGMTKGQIEAKLRDNLGVTKVIWLKEGVDGDDTDGHIDDIARFVEEETVVCMQERDSGDENSAKLKRDRQILSSYRNEGRKLDVVPIQMPKPVSAEDGRLPASYANFYVGNSAVLVPVFGDSKRDSAAVETLSGYFRGRKIVPIPSRALVYGFGGIHCVTQQQPA